MFVKIPNYFINLDRTIGLKEEKFKIINTNYIVSISYMLKKFSAVQIYYIIINTADGKKNEFEFLDKDEADKYMQLLIEQKTIAIE